MNNSSNSFNICPRCGNSNTLNAKFCSRCGGQLKVPEEAVVCHKCHTRNSAMANFCRNCGTTLKVGAQTKICPSCGNAVNAEDSFCRCGYSFVTMQQTAPQPVAESGAASGKKGRSTVVQTKKGGRGIAIAAFILILLFAYLAFAPYQLTKVDPETGAATTKVPFMRPDFLGKLDNGIVAGKGSDGTVVEGSGLYGFEFILLTINSVVLGIQNPGDNVVKTIFNNIGFATVNAEGEVKANWVMIALTLLVIILAITILVHLLVSFVRIFTKKRSKTFNYFFLIMAVISTLIVGLVIGCTFIPADGNAFLVKIANFFALPAGFTYGWVMVFIPFYYWFFFIYSAAAKLKRVKEVVA